MNNRKYFFSNILITTTAVVLLASCNKDYDRVFNESTDARVQAELNRYTTLLTTAPYGWKVSLLTGSGIRYFYYIDFNADGSVTMLSDFNESTAGTLKSSLWTLKALQSTTLSFTTYSYIHLPADPDGAVNGGNTGEGRISDSEFAFAGTSGDSLVLEGIQRGSRLTFLKATEEEQGLVLNGRIKDILHYATANKALKLSLTDDDVLTFAFNATAKMLTAQYLADDGKHVVNNKLSYVISMDGLVLSEPIISKGISIQAFLWDAQTSSYYIQVGTDRKEVTVLNNVQLFSPSIHFSDFIGYDYIALQIPHDADLDPLPGQSAAFINLYQAAAAGMSTGQYHLTLYDMYFIFDVNTKKMYLLVYVVQNGTLFACQFGYTYSITGSSDFKFTYGGADDNGGAIYDDMVPILDYISNDVFSGEYVGGGLEPLGGFFSQEHPEFSVGGYLVN